MLTNAAQELRTDSGDQVFVGFTKMKLLVTTRCLMLFLPDMQIRGRIVSRLSNGSGRGAIEFEEGSGKS